MRVRVRVTVPARETPVARLRRSKRSDESPCTILTPNLNLNLTPTARIHPEEDGQKLRSGNADGECYWNPVGLGLRLRQAP